jgi:rubredoxin
MLIWIEQPRFQGFGCAECGWRFEPSGAPAGTSFDQMMRNFELQRDRAFISHVCAITPKEDYVPTGTPQRSKVKT